MFAFLQLKFHVNSSEYVINVSTKQFASGHQTYIMSSEPFHWFKNFTTLGGLGQIIGSTEKHWKAFWTILTLAFLAITGYSAIKIVIEYCTYNVVTNFTVDHQDRLDIPSVTICNVNRVHCGNLMRKLDDENGARKELLCRLFKLTGCDATVQVAERTINGKITSNYSICDGYNFTDIDDLHESFTQDEMSQAFLELYFKLNPTELSDLAHTPEDTIKKCSMGTIEVTDQCKKTMNGNNSVRVITPRYGVCYLHNFEALDSDTDPEAAGSSGPDYGLNLILDIQSHYYMRYGLSQTTGILMTLNDPRAMPMVLARPIFLAPNIQTGIKIQKQIITRQKLPYTTDCSDTYPEEYRSLFSFTSVNYSNDYCKSLCRVEYVNLTCGCIDPLLMEANFLSQVNLQDQESFCSVVIGSEQRVCSIEAMKNYSMGDTAYKCPCKPDCYKDSFGVSTFESYV